MAFGGKIHHEIRVELFHELPYKVTVAYIPFDEGHIGEFNFFFDCQQIAGVCKCVKDKDFNLLAMFFQQVFDKVGADKAGATGNEVFFHFLQKLEFYPTKLRIFRDIAQFSLRKTHIFSRRGRQPVWPL